MTVISAIIFSLVWGSIVWLVMTALFHDGSARPCNPGILLMAIISILAPSLLVAAGWTIPVAPQQGPVPVGGVAGQDLIEMTAAMGRLAREPVWQKESWAPLLILSVYVAGLTAHLGAITLRYRRLHALLKNARSADGYDADWPLLATAARTAPFAVGGMRAAIVIPDVILRSWPKDRIAMIIGHEAGHLRHRDPQVATALEFIVALFWFNPFLRVLVARWRSACELRADADALDNATVPQRKVYAATLLEAMRIAGGSATGAFSPSFTTRSIRNDKMRIKAILRGNHFAARGPRALVAHCLVWSLVVIGSAGALATTSASVVSMDAFVPGGRVVSPYGVKRLNKRDHTGVDVAARLRTPIAAPADAVVMEATDLFRGQWRWGKAVVLQFDDGLIGWFTHLESYWVKPGDKVAKGAYFGTVGNTGLSTGAHVHIEVYDGTKRVDPATIWPFLKMPGQ